MLSSVLIYLHSLASVWLYCFSVWWRNLPHSRYIHNVCEDYSLPWWLLLLVTCSGHRYMCFCINRWCRMEKFNLQQIFFEACIISLLQVLAGLWPHWSQNVPHHAWCLLIPPVHSLLMNRSSRTGNPIIIPFYVLDWQPHPQLHLMRCSPEMFPKGLWFVTEKQSQCLTLSCCMDYIT